MEKRLPSRTSIHFMASRWPAAAAITALLVSAGSAAAAPGDAAIAADGKVTVDDIVYDTMSEYHRSDAFKNNDRRCLSAAPLFSSYAATDCSLTSTTIDPSYEPANGSAYVIPVVFHVITHSDGRGEVGDALIQSQIAVLNDSFAAVSPVTGPGATDAKIRFALATTDPAGATTTGINRIANDPYFLDADSGVAMKTALNWDPNRYLNIYTNLASGALGYATFPQESVGDPQDGVVLLWTSVGLNPPQGGIYDGGDTGVHEVGHWLGLEHTFNGGCGQTPYASGDLIGDTVAESEPQYECTTAPSTCGGGNNPIENFMDYTPDACMNMFTIEQINRMRCTLTNYRGALATPAATADFEANRDELLVRFTDRSVGAEGAPIATRQWDFGDGATSSEASPSHTYADFGTYTVTLRVTDDGGGLGTKTLEVTLIAGQSDGGAGGGSGVEGGNLQGGCSSSGGPLGGFSAALLLIGLAIVRRRKI